jgi:hypothetical protein
VKTYEAFRRRLIRLVATTSWPEEGKTADEVAGHAVRLGLQPDILIAARAVVEEGRSARGLKPFQGRKTNEKDHPQLEIDMPEEVFHVWHAWCEHQQATSNAIIRGIIHAYLLGQWEPAWVSSHWRYKGTTLSVPRRGYEEAHKAAWPFRERVLLTRGAKGALKLRAGRTHTTPTAIVRGLMLEILEGRYRQVIPRDARAMFEDAERYMKHL